MPVSKIEKRLQADAEARGKQEREARAEALAREELARAIRDDERVENTDEGPIGAGDRDKTSLRMEGINVDKELGFTGPSSDAQEKVLKADAKGPDPDKGPRNVPLVETDRPPVTENPRNVSVQPTGPTGATGPTGVTGATSVR